MKVCFYVSLFLLISSCCLGPGECAENNTKLTFKIVDATTSEDLVFGPSKIYDVNALLFFSVNGTDTVYHSSELGFGSHMLRDSAVRVIVRIINSDTIFFRLNDYDVDTLYITTSMSNGGYCCGDYRRVETLKYKGSYGPVISVYTLKK